MPRGKRLCAGKDRDAHGAEVAQDAQDAQGTQEARTGPRAGPAKEHLLPALLWVGAREQNFQGCGVTRCQQRAPRSQPHRVPPSMGQTHPRPHSSAPHTSRHKPRGYEGLGDTWRLGQRDTSRAATTCKDRRCIPTWFAAVPFSQIPAHSPPPLLADRAQAQGGVPLKHRLQRALFVLHLKGKEEKPERTCLARNLLHKCQLSAIDSKSSRRAVFIS